MQTPSVIREFGLAAARPHSFDPRRNPYVVFGLLWGLTPPGAVLAHRALFSGTQLWSELSVSGFLGHPASLWLLLFPPLLAWIFGIMGTVRRDHVLLARRTIELLESEVARRTEALRDMYRQTVFSLSEAIEAKDPYTRGHCQRVWQYARGAALRLALAPEELEVLRFASYLHDIGKIQVPSRILNKPGALTAAEYDVVKQHPALGQTIVAPVVGLRRAARLIRCHHEREDGSGYPDGLTGDRIPLLGKILIAADALDAMTSDRSYRRGLSLESACQELRRCAGLSFDPRLVPGPARAACRHFDPAVVEAVIEGLGSPAEQVESQPSLVAAPAHCTGALPAGLAAGGAEGAGLFACGAGEGEAPPGPAGRRDKVNCWEVQGCRERELRDEGPGYSVCTVPRAAAMDGLNGGRAAGRICWSVPGALCRADDGRADGETHPRCLECSFFARVRREEGLGGFLLLPPAETLARAGLGLTGRQRD